MLTAYNLVFVVCLAFPCLLGVAAIFDLQKFLIPNWISLALTAAFSMAFVIADGELTALAWHAAAMLFVLLIGMALFFGGILGGGDAKLIAASSFWTGFEVLPFFLFYTAIAGCAVVLLFVILHLLVRLGTKTRQSLWTQRILSRPRDIPYGLAIAIGGITVFPRLSLVQWALGN